MKHHIRKMAAAVLSTVLLLGASVIAPMAAEQEYLEQPMVGDTAESVQEVSPEVTENSEKKPRVIVSQGYLGECKWSLDTDKHLVIEGRGTMPDYYGPWGRGIRSVLIKGRVENVGAYVFSNCAQLESVVIKPDPSLQVVIGTGAFQNCEALTSADLGLSVAEIGIASFAGCSNLQSLTLWWGLKKIDSYAFRGCSKLQGITLPKPVTEIGSYAFIRCDSLSSVKMQSSNLETIGDYAFANCNHLTDVFAPNSLRRIGNFAFGNCEELNRVVLNSDEVTIGTGAFYNCKSLNNLSLGSGVTKIGSFAFYSCKELSNVILPESVTDIEDYAFYGCPALSILELPETLQTIGKSAFAYCTVLGSVNIPSSVTRIGSNAFSRCTALENLAVAPGNTVYDSRNDCNAIIETATNTLLWGCKKTLIPETVKKIGNSAFYGYEGTQLVVPATVTECGSNAFRDCQIVYVFPGSCAAEYFQSNEKHSCKILTFGDIDQNGCVTQNDISMLGNWIVGAIPLDDALVLAADFNRDGRTDVRDMTALQRYLAQALSE